MKKYKEGHLKLRVSEVINEEQRDSYSVFFLNDGYKRHAFLQVSEVNGRQEGKVPIEIDLVGDDPDDLEAWETTLGEHKMDRISNEEEKQFKYYVGFVH